MDGLGRQGRKVVIKEGIECHIVVSMFGGFLGKVRGCFIELACSLEGHSKTSVAECIIIFIQAMLRLCLFQTSRSGLK